MLPIPGYPNTLVLAVLSGTSKTVPSTAMTRSPPKNAPGVCGVPNGRTIFSNSTASYSTSQSLPRFAD